MFNFTTIGDVSPGQMIHVLGHEPKTIVVEFIEMIQANKFLVKGVVHRPVFYPGTNVITTSKTDIITELTSKDIVLVAASPLESEEAVEGDLQQQHMVMA